MDACDLRGLSVIKLVYLIKYLISIIFCWPLFFLEKKLMKAFHSTVYLLIIVRGGDILQSRKQVDKPIKHRVNLARCLYKVAMQSALDNNHGCCLSHGVLCSIL